MLDSLHKHFLLLFLDLIRLRLKTYKYRRLVLLLLLGIAILNFNCWVDSATAKGNFTKRAKRLPILELDASKGFSQKNYEIETGVYYRWRIKSDGKEEYKLLAPELFRNSWINGDFCINVWRAAARER